MQTVKQVVLKQIIEFCTGIHRVRPDQKENIDPEWLAKAIKANFSDMDWGLIKMLVTNKLTYYEGGLTHPLIMNWIRTIHFKKWTAEDIKNAAEFFRGNK